MNHQQQRGFSAIEMMVVVAIIAILAMIAVPSSLNRVVAEQVKATTVWADAAKEPIELLWKTTETLPANNAEAGLPDANKMVSNYVTNMQVKDGAIHLTLGNKAHPMIKDKVLSIRPAVIEDSNIVPITWVCGHAEAPEPMVLKGNNETSIPEEFLPLFCKNRKK